MSGKVKVGQKSCNVLHGKVIANGELYQIHRGKVLVNGEIKEILFGPRLYPITITGAGSTTGGQLVYVTIDGVRYGGNSEQPTSETVVMVSENSTVECYVSVVHPLLFIPLGTITLNGEVVASGPNPKTFSYRVHCPARVTLLFDAEATRIDITEEGV